MLELRNVTICLKKDSRTITDAICFTLKSKEKSYRKYFSYRRNSFLHQERVAKKQRDDYDRQMEKSSRSVFQGMEGTVTSQ